MSGPQSNPGLSEQDPFYALRHELHTGGRKSIFGDVIHWWISTLDQLEITIAEYDVTIRVPRFAFAWRHMPIMVTSQC